MLERGWLEESGYFNNSCKSRVVSFYGVARVPLFLTTFSTILITLLNIFFQDPCQTSLMELFTKMLNGL